LVAKPGRPTTASQGGHAVTTHILHDSYLSLVTSRGGYNLLYLNPPYDHDGEDGRLEYQWLVRCRPWLQPGGLLVWVVPQHLLQMRKATRYLLSWYDRIQVYRFPHEHYGRFHQIVLFAVHRRRANIGRRPATLTPPYERTRAGLHVAAVVGEEESVRLPFPFH
jgi:hypothetical protein